MSDIAIKVESLSKAYRIGLAEQRHETLAAAAVSFIRSPFDNYRNLRNLSRFGNVTADHGPEAIHESRITNHEPPPSDMIWALKDVSFEVKHGEVLGIIGRNGAGKSTLLKILSRITEPTSGRALIYGRVGSLLEVGTGFHPDLTGRENVYLNGTILGMSKKEVDQKFDEIVAFSEMGKFIDTPVKRYSSGMRVRLAFAVAAHLDPEVLIVDEVLAVGDAEFQRKCFGQIGKVANCGATILLVSHQLPMITALCSRALLLEQGGIRTDGTVSEVLDCYLNSSRALQGIPLNQRTDRTGSGRIRVQELRLRDSASGALLEELSSGKAIDIELDYTSSGFGTLKTLVFTLVFKGANGEPLFTCSSDLMPNAPASWPAKGTARCSISAFPALPGQYSILLWVGIGKEQADRIDNATTFSVQAGDFFGSGKLPNSHKHGPLLVKHTWGIR